MGNPNSKNPVNEDDQVVAERRKFIRLQINVEIKYSLLKIQPTLKLTASKNISAGGICIMTEESFQLGDLLKLEIKLPEDPPVIHCVGKVAWVKSFSILHDRNERYDVGVEFLEIDRNDRERINKYVFSLKTRIDNQPSPS